MVSIYTLSDPRTDEVRYVGQTCQTLPQRLRSHVAHRNLNTHTGHWIKQLYSEDLRPRMEEIDRVSKEELCESEQYWIRWYRGMGYDLTNHAPGGEGNAGMPKTEEWKAKIGLANRGSQNGYAKLSEDEVREIRRWVADGLSHTEIAQSFDVSRRLIGMIADGSRWQWLI